MSRSLKHCCESMKSFLTDSNAEIIHYSEVFDEYGINVQDGGQSVVIIKYCPWCGAKLPDSKRIRWFDELEALGFESPLEEAIPEKYKTNDWYQHTQPKK